jgi:VanZ family protein
MPVPSRIDPRVLRAWFAMAMWAAFVWGLGGDTMAMESTSRFLGPLIDWLLPDLTGYERHRALYTLRKSAHVVEYAILAILTLRAMWLSWRQSLVLASVFSLGVVAAMAVADEVRQGRSSMRTGSGWDVLLDICGGLAAIAGFLLFQRIRRAASSRRPDVEMAP